MLPVSINPLRGQSNSPPELFFHHLNAQKGLSQSNPYFIYQDSYGFIWLGSLGGLDRFDGRTVKRYTHDANNPNSLSAAYIQSTCFEDSKGDLWFATYETLPQYRRKTDDFEHFKHSDSTGTTQVGYRVVFQEKNDILWVVINEYYLFRFDPEKKAWQFLDRLPLGTLGLKPFFNTDSTVAGAYLFARNNPAFQKILFDKNLKIRGNNNINLSGSNKYGTGQVICILPENDSLVWVGFPRYIAAYNPLNDKVVFYQLPKGYLFNVAFWGEQYLLAATGGGGIQLFDRINKYFSGAYRHIAGDDGSLNVDDAGAIYIDRSGGIWAQLNGHGADFAARGKIKFRKLDLTRAGHYIQFDGPSINYRPHGIFGMVEMPDGTIWCASRYLGIFKLASDGHTTRYCHNCVQTLPVGDDIPYLLVDRSERLWAFGWKGLMLKTKKSLLFNTVFPGEAMLHGIQLADGRVIGGGFSGGFAVLADSIKLKKRLDFYYKDGAFTRFFQDHSGLVWACRELTSVWVLDPAHDFAKIKEIPIKGDVFCFYESLKSDAVWIGTSDGLSRVPRKDSIVDKHFSTTDGLPDASVYAIVPDPQCDSTLWLTTNQGIVRLDLNSGSIHTFTEVDGLQAPEFNQFGFLNRRNGEVWLAGQEGINIFKPDSILFSDFRPNLYFTRITINGLESPTLRCAQSGAANPVLIKEINLTFRENNLFFECSALDFSDPGAVSYRFLLEGFDQNWQYTGRQNSILFPNLPPGKYKLRAEMSNADGQWTGAAQTLAINIAPPFWQTKWFVILMLLLLAGLIFLIYSRIKLHEMNLRRQISEMETRALRAQMNQHFIFNTLNAIRRYHITGDIAGAELHFTRFSRLIRLILENSRDTLVSLESELELLNNYIQIEQLRFGAHLFDYQIIVSDSLEIKEIEFPSMVLQPFVENAILHGLRYKTDGKGFLKILIDQDDDSDVLHIIIEDNGIGRKAAAAIEASGKPHRSMGLDITRRRLDMFRQAKKIRGTSLIITDLLDETDKAAGTRVEIWF